MNRNPCALTRTSESPEATVKLGAALGRAVPDGGLIIALVGPLGAGKTQFVKGLARGNGFDDSRGVTSPTFTLVHEYPGRLSLFHLDAYRLSRPAELLALGFEEMIAPGAIVVVEWADRVREVFPSDGLWVEFLVTADTHREITFRASGPLAEACLTELMAGDR